MIVKANILGMEEQAIIEFCYNQIFDIGLPYKNYFCAECYKIWPIFNFPTHHIVNLDISNLPQNLFTNTVVLIENYMQQFISDSRTNKNTISIVFFYIIF